MSESHPDPDLAGAGLSATGKTASDFEPGDPSPGTTYGAPAGTGAEEQESSATPGEQDAGEASGGNVKGA